MEIDSNSNEFIRMQKSINKLESKVDDIYDALVGTELHPGLKPRLESVEAKSEKTDKKVNGIYIYGTALLSVVGVLFILFKTGIL